MGYNIMCRPVRGSSKTLIYKERHSVGLGGDPGPCILNWHLSDSETGSLYKGFLRNTTLGSRIIFMSHVFT